MKNYHELSTEEPNKVGDRVIYYVDSNKDGKYESGEYVVHSAIVSQVDKEGNTTLVTGKMGMSAISDNHPNAPGYYSIDENGRATSRAYYRQN